VNNLVLPTNQQLYYADIYPKQTSALKDFISYFYVTKRNNLKLLICQ